MAFRRRDFLGSAARRVAAIAALSLTGTAAALVTAACIEACGSAESGGDRIALDTHLEPVSGAERFTTALGWNVTLTRALIGTGPFYYFDGAPPIVRLLRRQLPSVGAALGLSPAFAHPGHYKAGEALGQMLEPWSVDLLAGGGDLPTGDGVTGLYRSASFSLTSPPEGPLAADLAGHAAIVEGVAARDGVEARHFLATADLADVERSAADGYIDGCVFDELDIEADGRVTIQVTPKVWFDLVDFSELMPSTNDVAVEFPVDSQPKIAFALGLAQLSAYHFSFVAR